MGKMDCLRCYSVVLDDLVRAVRVVWPVVAGYAVLYATGAAIFLLNLRANKDSDGNLYVRHDSWTYLLARPYRYGKIQDSEDYERARNPRWFRPTSICVLYARAFNALLFMWPFVLVYWAAVCTVVWIFGTALAGFGYVKPNLSYDRWLEPVVWRDLDDERSGVRFVFSLPITWYIGVVLIALAAIKFTLFLKVLAFVGMIALCASPLLAVIVGVTFGVRKVLAAKDEPGTHVALITEYIGARKEKFCKMVAIK